MMFGQLIKAISNEVQNITESRYRRPSNDIAFDIKLNCAIQVWCRQFEFNENITNDIVQGCRLHEVNQITNYIWQESIQEKKTWKIPTPVGELPTLLTIENQFYKHVNFLFQRMSIRSGNMNIIVILAFVITAVGYWLYVINKPKQAQQPSRREEPKQYIPVSPSPPVQKITNHFLVLVISASQANFLESMKSKGRIDFSDGEELYEMTKYLWLGTENAYKQVKNKMHDYEISRGEESEYDIYLVDFELKQSDERFKPNVNQLDRYDAFRKLADLVVDFTISPRLQMEAYGNFEVYNR
jgi:hypothetical protein